MISLVDALPVLMDLQLGGDRVLRKLAYSHVVQDIRRLNIKNKNDPVTKPLQNILFNLLQVWNSHLSSGFYGFDSVLLKHGST